MAEDARKAWNTRLAATQALSARALQKEREGDLTEAYASCIETAQNYLWLVRNTNDKKAQSLLKEASTKVLARAEKIKTHKKDVRPKPTSLLDDGKAGLAE